MKIQGNRDSGGNQRNVTQGQRTDKKNKQSKEEQKTTKLIYTK